MLLTFVFKAEKGEKTCPSHLQAPFIKQPVEIDFGDNRPHHCSSYFLASILFRYFQVHIYETFVFILRDGPLFDPRDRLGQTSLFNFDSVLARSCLSCL